MDRIGIFLYYPGSLKFHPSIMNSAKMWMQHGYGVDIFKPFNQDEGIISNDELTVVHVCKYQSNPILRIKSLFDFFSNCLKYLNNKIYKVLIGIDAYGLIISGIISFFLKIPYIYFSLEILSTKFNYISLKQKNILGKTGYLMHHCIIKLFERYFHRKALFTIIQDENRWKTLKRINRINHKAEVLFVPNAPLKDNNGFSENINYLNNKYGISKSKKVVLYAGSLGEWVGIDRILNNMDNWPDDVVFVVHGRGNPLFIEHLKNNIISKHSNNVILSLDQLREDEYNLLVRSSHIGISWYYDKEDPNVYTIGAASGKLFYYLKHCLPTIINRWPGLVEIVDGWRCGICVDSEYDIGSAIKKILLNYRFYSDNAKKCFEQYEFSRHYQMVINRVLEQAM